MNMDTYNSMPDDVKAIIDDKMAVREFSLNTIAAFENVYDMVLQGWLDAGGERIEWTPEAIAELDELMAPVWDNWIAEKEAQGLPARQVIDEYYNALKALGEEVPAIGYTPGG